jgi:hypothetical protein
MAQTNYTPISLYYSTTAAAAPTAGNLINGELAININDGKLFYKDSGGSVQVIGWKNVPISTLAGAGTGVLTALGVNVGTAGAFVVNGGALGTPSFRHPNQRHRASSDNRCDGYFACCQRRHGPNHLH